jgi:uncharacterized small protein (DUF1192 family)
VTTDPNSSDFDLNAILATLRQRAARQVELGHISANIHTKASDHFRSIVARNRPGQPPHPDAAIEARLYDVEKSKILLMELSNRIGQLEERIETLEAEVKKQEPQPAPRWRRFSTQKFQKK